MIRILVALTLLIGLAACDVGTFPVDGDATPADTVDGGEVLLTFNGAIKTDVTVCTACHNETAKANYGNYAVDTYAGITGNGSDGTPNVDPADPANSLLVLQMDPDTADPTIIEHTGYPSAERAQLYLDWITAGAPEN